MCRVRVKPLCHHASQEEQKQPYTEDLGGLNNLKLPVISCLPSAEATLPGCLARVLKSVNSIHPAHSTDTVLN